MEIGAASGVGDARRASVIVRPWPKDGTGERCGICAKPIKSGDKATYRHLPDKGVVRVHNVCYAKASMEAQDSPGASVAAANGRSRP